MRARVLVGLLLVGSSLGIVAGRPAVASPGQVRCEGRVATIVGTPRSDHLFGTPGDDVIAALGGEDRLFGRGGDDVLCGGDGADSLVGGTGADRLLGGKDGDFPAHNCSARAHFTEGDRLFAGPGDDYIDGGYDPRQTSPCGARPDLVSFRKPHTGIRARLGDPGELGVVRAGRDRDLVMGERSLEVQGTKLGDYIRGGGGDEVLGGNGGTDEILGGAGDDRLRDDDYYDGRGPTDGDRLVGGSGADDVWSAGGQDDVAGGEGDDHLDTVVSCSTVTGGPGSDRLQLGQGPLPVGTVRVAFDAAAGTVAALPARAACGRFTELESYVMQVGLVPADFAGTDGADRLSAFGTFGLTASMLGGDDVVTGTDNDDVLDGGAGQDVIDGALGRDVCISAETATSCDADSLPLPPASCDGRLATIVSTRHGESLMGTPGDDVIFGSDNGEHIDGLGGNDVICGRAGSDTVVGGAGDDRIFAGEDYEYPEGGSVGDTVAPGSGDDVVDLGDGPGLDTLSYADSATGISSHLAPVGGTFTVAGGEGTDTVTTHAPYQFWGSDLADVITGSDGDDRIMPRGGDDVVDGGAGDDQVEDGCPFRGCQPLDHDVLLGGEGADILASGIGRDDLDGGPGDDILSVTSREGAGTVNGGVGDDRLRVFVRGAATQGHVEGGAGTDVLDVIAYNLDDAGGRVVVDAARGRLGSTRLGDLITFNGTEAYDLDAYNTGTERHPLVFRFLGSSSSERLSVTTYAVSVLRASMRAGDDLVWGSRQDDVVDGGAGTDTVHALRGHDRCIDVEVARGCEVLSP